MNRSLGAAKRAKQDEFYTQYIDIQKEVEAYPEFDSNIFRGKVIDHQNHIYINSLIYMEYK